MENLSLKKCCICNNEICGSFAIIGEDKYHLSCIEKLRKRNESLEKENKILRENAEYNSEVVDKYWWENKHYKHIIDELEKWSEEEIKSWTEAINEERDYELVNEFALKIDMFKEVLDKLQELKGSDKE